MFDRKPSIDMVAAAAHNIEESKYWTQKLSGEPVKSSFPYDRRKTGIKGVGPDGMDEVTVELSPGLTARILKIINNSDYRLHMILVAAAVLLLEKYTGNDDIIIGTPVYKQETEGKFINTVLVLRNRILPGSTFKDLLIQVKETVIEAVKNQNYPIETLLYKLDIPRSDGDGEYPLFDAALLLENIHDRNYLRSIDLNVIFSFLREGEKIGGTVSYNPALYEKASIERVAGHFIRLLEQAGIDIASPLDSMDILSEEEKRRIVINFNETGEPSSMGGGRRPPIDKTIHRLFEEQAGRTPDRIAVAGTSDQGLAVQVAYRESNERSNRLARWLREKGGSANAVVGIMSNRSVEMIIGIMGILKSGGAYLPVDPEYPANRIHYMLENCNVPYILTKAGGIENHSFTGLQNLLSRKAQHILTQPRTAIPDLDLLPFPDRSLIDYEKYSRNISLAMVKHCISLQGTRGCPYNCAYCAKLWPKKHVVRSAEHIFAEVKRYYEIGIRRFSFIDDIFNLDIDNSSRFFRMVIDNGLELQLFFPAGLRGDIMTADYIDLMVKAGTVNISVALETASPRLQKSIGKNLHIPKLRENLDYICTKHPGVILDLFTMHGLPTETEAEAMMTLEFIKSLKWLHFPLINILKIYPGTDMEKLALESGITQDAIFRSENLSWHESSETLPFDKNFTMKYQADFLNDYFLLKERLLKVLPSQVKILTEDEMVQKYNSYLPVDINSFDELLRFVGITREELRAGGCVDERRFRVEGLNEKLKGGGPLKTPAPGALKILLLDLSQSFSADNRLLDDLFEPPLGLMYLLTWLNRHFDNKIHGKIAKSGIDFDDYHELNKLLKEFNPGVIGIRTLTFYKDFFHKTISLIRQWGFHVPVITGGPYATNGYKSLLRDRNVDLVVMAEGELTFTEVIEKIIADNGKLPDDDVLSRIPGIAYVPGRQKGVSEIFARPVILMDWIGESKTGVSGQNLPYTGNPGDPAYVIYTSGSTGRPKGVMIEHKSVNNLVAGLNERVYKHYGGQLKVGLLAPFVFDASVKQIFAALLLGHSLYLIPEEARLDGIRLLEYYRQQVLDISDGTPAYMELLAESMGGNRNGGPGVKHFLIGGEQLSTPAVERFFKKSGTYAPRITNVYGPTECCVDTASFEITADNICLYRWETIPIGIPLPNVRIYILGKGYRLQPLGVVGELFIGGAGVGRGYVNSPELTADKFTGCRLPVAGSLKVLYRSGDFARRLVDGNIEFIGRIDHQVKIRGYRIELKEIENQLLLCPGVKEAVVATAGRGAGEDLFICAYIVSEKEISVPGLKNHLLCRLPEYMMPWKFVQVEKIPLTPNGKVDKKALPVPAPGEGGAYVPPENKTQEKLVEIWAEILGLEKAKIGIDMDFFDLGGHSLKAVILVSRIHRELDVKISLVEIFTTPVIRKLAEYINEAATDKFVPIKPVEEREYYILSSAQKRLYFLQQLDMTGIGYNMPLVLPLGKGIEKDKFEFTLRRLIDRHESLRTSIGRVNEEVVQRIQKAGSIEFSLDYSEAGKTGLGKIISDYIRPFDLSRPPLIRAGLIRLSDGHCIWVVDMHHIVSDGTSHTILTEDFLAEYNGKELKPLHIRYKDFALWQQRRLENEEIKEQLEYWLDLLGGKIPFLNLPTDQKRPLAFTFEGDSYRFMVSGDDAKRFKGLGAKGGGTLYMNMLAALNVLFYKYTGQSDITIGSGIAGRKHADLQGVVGMFINTLAMRNYPEGEKSYESFLKEVITDSVRGFENQEVQFEDLVEKLDLERDASRNPVFDIMMIVQNFRQVGEGGRGSRTGYADVSAMEILPPADENPAAGEYKISTSKFDMTFYVHEQGDDISINIEYYTAIFKSATIHRFASHFKNVIKSVVDDSSVKLKDIEMISEDEKKKIIYEFNNTKKDYPGDKTLGQLFEEQVEQTPGNIAAAGTDLLNNQPGRVPFTYRQLNERSNRLAAFLKAKGVKPGVIVGVMVDRSLDMMAAILGIIKAGGAYLPMDPIYPPQRIKYMLADSSVFLVLLSRGLAHLVEDKYERVEIENSRLYEGKDFIPGNTAAATDLVYVIYTSGSTGKPKGVMIEHRALVNFIKGMTDIIDFNRKDSIFSLTTLSFDIFGLETLLPLVKGSRVVIGTREEQMNAEAAALAMSEQNVTILQVTPSGLSMLLLNDACARRFNHLRYLLVGGEVFPVPLLNRAREVTGGKIYNVYGPTETTIWSTVKEIRQGKPLNIGKPIANTQVYILDNNGKIQPLGVQGELCIAGMGLARGYINKVQLTGEKFLPDPHEPGEYIYQTGDIARWLPDGDIEFIGRKDEQVKIRGFRIELGEIEKQLAAQAGIGKAVVTCRNDEAGDKYLCAYIEAPTIDSEELRKNLSLTLPYYMIPSYFVTLDKIPLTPNGKIDWKVLPAPTPEAGETYQAPTNEIEEKLVEIWTRVLDPRGGNAAIGINDNFFRLGGHSLKATAMIDRVHKELNVSLPLVEVFKSPTIKGLSVRIIQQEKHGYIDIVPVEQREYYALTPAQRRLYILYQMDKINTRYNMPMVMIITGQVDKSKFEDTFRQLIERNEILRTSFIILENEPIQKVHREVAFKMEYHEAAMEKTREIVNAFVRPFDLTRAQLLRMGLIKINDKRYVWMVDLHHIVADGVSALLLQKDFLALYNGRQLSPQKLHYKDFSQWQNRLLAGGEIEKQEKYWLDRYKGDIPTLNLPFDYAVSTAQRLEEGDIVVSQVKGRLIAQLYETANETGATLYMILLAAFNILLSKYTKQEDIVVGSPIAGRRHIDLENMIGMFVNMLAMRNFPREHITFGHFLEEVKKNALDAYDNQDYQFEELVRKLEVIEYARNPLCNVVFVLQNVNQRMNNTFELMVEPYPYASRTVKFDLQLEVSEGPGQITLRLNYPTALFSRSSAETIVRHYLEILEQVMENTGVNIRDISVSHTLGAANTNIFQEENISFGF